MRRKWLFILCCALLHYVAMTVAGVASFGYVMARFDNGGDETLREHIITRVSEVLAFPGYNVVERYGIVYLGRWGDLLMVLNSLLWAVCVYALVALLLRQKARARAA